VVIHRIQTDETALSTAKWDNSRFGPVDNFCEVSGHFGKRAVGWLKSGGGAKQMRNEWCFTAVPGRWLLDADRWLLGAGTPYLNAGCCQGKSPSIFPLSFPQCLNADRPAPTVLGRPSCAGLDAIACDYQHCQTDSQAKPDLFITESHIERFPYAH